VQGNDGVGELQRLMGRPTFVENCVVEVLGSVLRNTKHNADRKSTRTEIIQDQKLSAAW